MCDTSPTLVLVWTGGDTYGRSNYDASSQRLRRAWPGQTRERGPGRRAEGLGLALHAPGTQKYRRGQAVGMPTGPRRPGGADDRAQSSLPECSLVGGTCPVFEMGQRLGQSVLSTLAAFIVGADEGARLTLQKNPQGFTIQVTGSVIRAEEHGNRFFGLTEARGLREDLDQLTRSQGE